MQANPLASTFRITFAWMSWKIGRPSRTGKKLRQNLSLQDNPDHSFRKHKYSVRGIEVQSVTRFGPKKIGFVKLNATIERDALSEGYHGPEVRSSLQLPGTAFLRGGSVDILMILRPIGSYQERYVVLTEQPRIPAGSLTFLEIPAGMIENDTFKFAAAKEVEEETGFKIPIDELVDMTDPALQNSEHSKQNLNNAMYPSPGGCDESIALFVWEKELDRMEIEELRGRLTGVRKQDEMITLRVRPYEDLWKEGARDAKTLAAWALYEGLTRSGILEKYWKEKRLKAARSSEGSRGSSAKRIKRSTGA